MSTLIRRGAAVALAATVALGFLDPNDYATAVHAFVPGPFGSGNANLALGAPMGTGTSGGTFDTAMLGVGGTLTLELGNRCVNGAGADLLVCENPFLVSSGGSFAEVMFVEVSSDGTHFARFPTRYTGQNSQLPSILGAPIQWYRGFAGVRPVLANPSLGHDPFDLVHAGADAFDLQDLAGDPLVQNGQLDLFDVAFVRLEDVDSGNAVDSVGTTVWDCGLDSTSSADVDALVALNSDANQAPGRPRVELSIDSQGFLVIEVLDFDGWKDVKTGLSAALDGAEFPFATLFSLCTLTQINAVSFTLVTGPVPAGLFPYELRITATDKQGLRGGDALRLP
jgi:hypothetical protein